MSVAMTLYDDNDAEGGERKEDNADTICMHYMQHGGTSLSSANLRAASKPTSTRGFKATQKLNTEIPCGMVQLTLYPIILHKWT